MITSNRKILFGLRIVQAILLLIAFALVLSGTGFCMTASGSGGGSGTGCSSSATMAEAKYWKDQFPEMGGQVFVVLASMIMMGLSIAAAVVAFKSIQRVLKREMIWAVVSALICLLCGSLEIWYTVWMGKKQAYGVSGSTIVEVSIYIQAWAASVFFLFLSAIVYFADAFVSYRFPGM